MVPDDPQYVKRARGQGRDWEGIVEDLQTTLDEITLIYADLAEDPA